MKGLGFTGWFLLTVGALVIIAVFASAAHRVWNSPRVLLLPRPL